MESNPTIAFIVNGGYESAMGHRARSLAAHLKDRYDLRLAYRDGNRLAATFKFLGFLVQLRPRAAYVFDMAYAGVLGAWLYKIFFRRRLIIETGDVIYELMRSTGNRGWLGLWLTRLFERFALRVADRLVVRGRLHKEWLAQQGIRSEVVQDGVETAEFKPFPVQDLRRQHELEGVLTVGLVGSSVWSEKLRMCYGWELVEVLRLLKSEPVKGLMIGDGSGIEHLKALCREYGIEDRVLFLGYVPYAQLPRHLNLIDVCLSTQTDDLVGRVRTSGKLPLYLAAGRYVLASEVGEAAFVLEREMLVQYEGVKDLAYPQRLAERIRAILNCPEVLKHAAVNISIAQEHFEYSRLARRVGQVIESVLDDQGRSER
jgi:glycosyltransferase involved in cell wall biosynthesis